MDLDVIWCNIRRYESKSKSLYGKIDIFQLLGCKYRLFGKLQSSLAWIQTTKGAVVHLWLSMPYQDKLLYFLSCYMRGLSRLPVISIGSKEAEIIHARRLRPLGRNIVVHSKVNKVNQILSNTAYPKMKKRPPK